MRCPVCETENEESALACASCGVPPAVRRSARTALPPGTTLRGGAFSVGRVLGEGVRIVVVGVGHTLPYAEQLSAAKAVLETPRAPTVRPEATVSAAAVETSRLVVMIRRCMRNPHLVSLLRSVTDPRQSCKSRHALEASRLIRQRGESCAGSGDRAYISPVRTEVTVRDKERARTVAIGVAARPGGCGGVTQC